MKTTRHLIVTIGGLLAMAAGFSVQAGIQGSVHDLSAMTGNTTLEICVFCHTPHGSDISAPAPLWNKILPDAAGFTTYDALGTATLDGEISLLEGGISLACLSCHDGATAIDLVLNAPTLVGGEYRYNAAGTTITLGGVTMGAHVGPIDAANPVPILGKDLRDDHPVGVQYAGGGLTWGTTTVSLSANDKLFNDPIYNAGTDAMWVDELGAGTGKLPLFKGATLGPLVECATCHDPHLTDNGSFLRVSNAGSNLCLSCHTK